MHLNRTIKAAMGKLDVPHSERYSSHAFRLGSAQELKETWHPWAVVASAGRWRSDSLPRYADTSEDVETEMSNLLSNPLLSESEDGIA